MRKLVVDLDSPGFHGLDGVDRVLKMSLRLQSAGLKFAAIDGLWPAEIELE